MDSCLFPRALAQSETQTAQCKFWSRLADSIFYDINKCSKSLSKTQSRNHPYFTNTWSFTVNICSSPINGQNRSVWKLLVLEGNTWYHKTVSKVFVLRTLSILKFQLLTLSWNYSYLLWYLFIYLSIYSITHSWLTLFFFFSPQAFFFPLHSSPFVITSFS